jgi:lytic murein transglycosylase
VRRAFRVAGSILSVKLPSKSAKRLWIDLSEAGEMLEIDRPELKIDRARPWPLRHRRALGMAVGLALVGSLLATDALAKASFEAFLAALRPDAVARGIAGATFDRETSGLAPDLTLPDLVHPGRPDAAPKGQAEFTVAPQDYVSSKRIAALMSEGRALARKHAGPLAKIESQIGVDASAVLAIWGRETAFGKYKPRHDAIRALATQAFAGRRKDLFRDELLHALKLIDDGRLKRAEMRASWAGAMGLTQFMPSEFYASTVDLDGDGRIDLFGSVPDALGSAATQLKQKGWIAKLPWGIEVRPGPKVDCANEGPGNARPLGEWARLGVVRVDGRPLDPAHHAATAYMMSPGGTYGPQFLVTENFKVLRAYNTSDLYATFVGHLADRIAGGKDFVTPWAAIRQLEPAGILEVQSHLDKNGFAIAKLDGRIGSETRLKIGLYQRAKGLGVDCWPSSGLLAAMRRSAAR